MLGEENPKNKTELNIKHTECPKSPRVVFVNPNLLPTHLPPSNTHF